MTIKSTTNGTKKKISYNAHDIESVHAYRVCMKTFTIFVGTDPNYMYDVSDGIADAGIDAHLADRFTRNLHMMQSEDPTRPILVKMSSPGGEYEPGMEMFSAILCCQNPVTVLSSRYACSMSSIVPLAADRFFIDPAARYMIHRGRFEFSGLDQEAETADRERAMSRECMFRIYAARLRERGPRVKQKESKVVEDIKELLRRHVDVWFSPVEAREWGFVDGIFMGDWDNLRATERNELRRRRMLNVLLKPTQVPRMA